MQVNTYNLLVVGVGGQGVIRAVQMSIGDYFYNQLLPYLMGQYIFSPGQQ